MSKLYKAKKEYVCSVCKKLINVGDEYYPCGKKPYLYKYHRVCKPQTWGRPLRLFGGAEELLNAVAVHPVFIDELEGINISHFYKLRKMDVPVCRLRYSVGKRKNRGKKACRFTIYYLEGDEGAVFECVIDRFGFFPATLKTGLGLPSTFQYETIIEEKGMVSS